MVLIGETGIGRELRTIGFSVLELKKICEENESLSFLIPKVDEMFKIHNHLTNEVIKAQIKEMEEL